MRSIIILIGSRVVNGLFGLLLFVMLKEMISITGYSSFSSSYANLTLLSTLAGGVLSGLLLKNAFHLGSIYKHIIYFYTAFFMALIIVPLELAILLNVFNHISRFAIYFFILGHLISSVVLIHYQLNQQFLKMTIIEIFRTIFPLVFMLVLKYSFHVTVLSIDHVILIMALGNLLGFFFFIRICRLSISAKMASIKAYLSVKLKSDLSYGFSFASFNALAQLIIVRDRDLIVANPDAVQSSKVAYTADQLTKITNGVLFPLNTKVSSEVGGLIRDGKQQSFYRRLFKYSLFTLVAGSIIIAGILGFTYLYHHLRVFNTIDLMAVVYYGLANTIYLACLIYQKRYDYSRFKLLPTLLLLAAGMFAFLLIDFVKIELSFFFVSATLFGLFLWISTWFLPSHKLVLKH
ncbi:hypothetical protein [Pedobacter insulae]|uniref:Uncharacterized protein n=1 Tax=Pedobacter insulae TaxID=414048 RepID=A0A1I2TIF6_9SPHI|nr:hypothetical protein [Pedobacter insulae]SFG62121.1 hypothetical protein SAMN04489864_101297 [Pedobacter insulae]